MSDTFDNMFKVNIMFIGLFLWMVWGVGARAAQSRTIAEQSARILVLEQAALRDSVPAALDSNLVAVINYNAQVLAYIAANAKALCDFQFAEDSTKAAALCLLPKVHKVE